MPHTPTCPWSYKSGYKEEEEQPTFLGWLIVLATIPFLPLILLYILYEIVREELISSFS